MARTFRRAAKVLLLDPKQRVLLFRGIDRMRPDDAPRWFPVGGGLEAGEEPAAAAVREVFEETGLHITDPGPVVVTIRFDWEFEGSAYDQEETYFLVPVSEFVPLAARWSDTEHAMMRGHRWWSLEELRATKEAVYPDGLAELLERLLAS